MGAIPDGLQVQVPSGSAGHRKIGVWVFQYARRATILPACEVFQNDLANCGRSGESAVEKQEIDGFSFTKEISQMAGDGGVLGIGESHFAEASCGFEWTLAGADRGKEPT